MEEHGPPVAYGSFTHGFVDSLAAVLRGSRVLEVFAGNGLLASKLAARGVQVVATSLFSGHDGHRRGMQFPVLEMDAVRAVRELGPEADVLLMSWPTVTEAALVAALEWGEERPIAFLGEITRHDLWMAGLGGCATDAFFEATEVVEEIPGYQGRGMLDRAVVMRTRPAWAEAYRGRRDGPQQPSGPRR